MDVLLDSERARGARSLIEEICICFARELCIASAYVFSKPSAAATSTP